MAHKPKLTFKVNGTNQPQTQEGCVGVNEIIAVGDFVVQDGTRFRVISKTFVMEDDVTVVIEYDMEPA
ncbi:hypothetical protein LRQ11_00245 [Pseudomonas sp. MAFF 311095]|uniref:Uncharacterized protein n=1 Tax=Pseudomonas petroselini TaxID=2899822 RepID=A0ABS8QPM7_9PSED|nr:hypothetical protein [Pseudomonas petroselini]MCD7037476.1 hypothetical protein [Pseudomonas petroselini]MCD7046498.1 hypothetical protein [Pseudomonas petroselini]MCD7066592.1 hypothetical protein [Pseudomonas petroselini]MCD7077441.1 hypothetical protein [Pseudomonas petroselini]